MKRKAGILIMILMVAALITLAQEKGKTQEKVSGGVNEFTIPLSDPSKRGHLKAHLNYGSITIKGTARKDVLVKYSSDDDDDDDDRRGRNRNNNSKGADSKDGLKRIGGGGMELSASENNNAVKVGSDSWGVKTNLEIEVPAGFDMKVSTYNDGDLLVTNVQGELELTNYNGPITALNISGSAVVTTYNGDIKATFDKATDGTPMSFSTYNGDVDLSFPASIKATFKMKTEQGEIYTGFDMNIVSSGPVRQEDKKGGYKLKIDEWKRGDVNGGGAEISARSQNGDIYIRKK
jgi:hypothetical protein